MGGAAEGQEGPGSQVCFLHFIIDTQVASEVLQPHRALPAC